MKKNMMLSPIMAVILGMTTALTVIPDAGMDAWAAQTEDAESDDGRGYEVHEEEEPETEEVITEEVTEAQEAQKEAASAAAKALKSYGWR